MERRNFAQVLKDAKVDITKEYQRLYTMFNSKKSNHSHSFRNVCEYNFNKLPFKGTCLTLSDFDEYYGFNFFSRADNVEINHLVSCCEYLFNIAKYNSVNIYDNNWYKGGDFLIQIRKVIELIGYMETSQDNLTIFVPKSQPAIVVSEMLPANLSYKVIEYNHHSMKGDLARKQATLKLLADRLESKRTELKGLNKSLEDDIFYLVNNLNIRHNNIEVSSPKYKKAVAEMPEEELEEWYDKIYDMCLYAFMTLDQADRNAKVKELKIKIEGDK